MRERGYTDTPNHNPIITLISALSAMGLRDAPNQPPRISCTEQW